MIVDKPLDVLQHPVVAGLGECGVGVGAEQHQVRAVDTDEIYDLSAVRHLPEGLGKLPPHSPSHALFHLSGFSHQGHPLKRWEGLIPLLVGDYSLRLSTNSLK